MADPFTLNPVTLPTTGTMLPDSGLSFERDIAPLQKKFFRQVTSNRSIRPEVADQLSMQFASNLGSVYETSRKAAEMEQSSKQRQLQYESALFTLDREREKAQRERNMLSSLIPLQQELDRVISDPNSDEYTKQQELGRIGVRNAQLFALNPAAETAYRAAQMGVVKKPKEGFTTEEYLRSGGRYEFLKEHEKTLGRPIQTTDVLPTSVAMTGLEKTKAGILSAEESKKRDEETAKLMRERQSTLRELVTKAKPKQDMYKADLNEFDTPISETAVAELVGSAGFPEEQKQFGSLDVRGKITLAQQIAAEQLSGRRAFNRQSNAVGNWGVTPK